jgi:hypothetical protein
LVLSQVALYQISAAQLAPQDALPIGFTVTAAHTEVPPYRDTSLIGDNLPS